jgi:mono/diheme cytochrome c family protein
VRKWIAVLGFAALALPAAEKRPVPWERNLKAGQALYRDNCVVCHDVDKPQSQHSQKPGPSFYQLFRREKMPIASMKPNRDYIKVRVKFGGPLMPAFQKWLSEREIDLIIDFLASK